MTIFTNSPDQFRQTKIAQQVLLALGLTVVGGLLAVPAYAQEKGAVVEEIIVTARKVREKLQDVPLAITAFTSESLKNSGATNLGDIGKLTPGMIVADAGQETTRPVLRGMSNVAEGDPNVAIFLDGIYLSNGLTISMGLMGLERVEVVKGPVSAMYGRNAYAGAINYVSKRPVAKFSGDAAVTLGTAGKKTVSASVNSALGSEMLRGRIALVQDQFDGTYKDQVNGLRAGGYDKKDAQITLLFAPTENLEITGNYYHGDDFFNDPAMTYTEGNCGPKSANAATLGRYTRYCGELDTHQQPVEVADIRKSGTAGNKRKVEAASLKVAYDAGFADFSALLGYNNNVAQRFTTFTGIRDGIVAVLVPGPGTIKVHEMFGADSNNDDKSWELRAASKRNQALRWAAGLYHYDANLTSSTITSIDGSVIPTGQTIGAQTPTGVGAPNFVTTNGEVSQRNISLATTNDKIDSQFLGVDYDILANLTAAVEYRHTKQTKFQDIVRSNSFANVVRPLGYYAPASWAYNNYRASLTYKLTPDTMLYGTAGNGTKAGGFNLRATLPSEVSFNPETTKSLEAGIKSSWLQNRLQFNLSVYDIKSKDLQLAGASADPTTPALVTKNFGGLNNKGYEAEFIAVPVKGVKLNLGIATADPKFAEGTYDFSNAAICATIPSCAWRITTVATPQGNRTVVNLAGLQLRGTSKTQVTFGAEFTQRVADGYDWFGRVDYKFESRQYQGDNTNLGLAWLPEKSDVNVRTGVTRGPLTLTLYINNLTNNTVPSLASNNVRLTDFNGQMTSYLPPERTFGATFAYKF